jgi:hypothetical protein
VTNNTVNIALLEYSEGLVTTHEKIIKLFSGIATKNDHPENGGNISTETSVPPTKLPYMVPQPKRPETEYRPP